VTEVMLTVWALSTGGALGLAAIQWRARTTGLLGVRRACHELRGPITAARLGLQLGARTGQLSPASLRALDLELGRAGLALDDLAGPAGPMFAQRGAEAPIDGAALLESSVLAWRASAELHGARLRLRCGAGGVTTVSGDRLRLAQVTGNLIANAIEHGGREILVTGEARPGVLRIEVRDDGSGLPPAIARSLAPDTGVRSGGWCGRRVPRRTERHRGGCDPAHGHGLAIAARIVAQHRGRLFAADCERGARLVVELPLI
jgi:signal transduction histidine kinase